MEVASFIERFNTSWIDQNADMLRELMDENVIFLKPDLKSDLRGRMACMKSFEEYWAVAKTVSFSVINTIEHHWDNLVNVTLTYNVRYKMAQVTYQETGTEIWTLCRKNSQLKMVWRAIIRNDTN